MKHRQNRDDQRIRKISLARAYLSRMGERGGAWERARLWDMKRSMQDLRGMGWSMGRKAANVQGDENCKKDKRDVVIRSLGTFKKRVPTKVKGTNSKYLCLENDQTPLISTQSHHANILKHIYDTLVKMLVWSVKLSYIPPLILI